jgi:hypothetical protein
VQQSLLYSSALAPDLLIFISIERGDKVNQASPAKAFLPLRARISDHKPASTSSSLS